MYCRLRPTPTANIGLTFQATEGLMLTVSRSDFTAWKRPTQSESHSVVRPYGELMPMPAQTDDGTSSHDRYAAGTKAQPPASPPSPPTA